MGETAGLEERGKIAIELNDMIVNSPSYIPLVWRGRVSSKSNTLGEAGRVTCNLVPAPEINASTNNDWCMTQDIDEASRLLDEAGWAMGSDGVREKDGERLSVLYQTSTNSVRQAAQALIKQWWNELGVEVELRNIDAGVFFGGDPGSPDTLQKFYADVEMYANNFDGTDPEKYLGDWVCAEIPRPETQWQGGNTSRLCSEEFDALHAKLGETAGPEERGEDRHRAQRHDRQLGRRSSRWCTAAGSRPSRTRSAAWS